ncbi:hypothetical protein BC941DRAFT_476629 [Chlamydoabsidia padenii]|nr:hypothetical protein BC941DRAFT_476629 [Chlamydoabsidia padenii]
MEKSQDSPSTTTSPSGWKIKIRSHSNNSNSSLSSLPTTPVIESDNAFDRRLDLWAQTTTFQNIASHICHDVEKDMLRRQQFTSSTQQGDHSHTSSSTNSPNTNGFTQPEQQKSTMGDMKSFMFQHPSILTDKEYASWALNGKEVHHPHQWLKLASLFHIHPKTAHQRSLLYPATLQAAKNDRQISSESNRKQLENYLDLRRAQNRNYAENAVTEGVKLYNAKNINEALDYYKRALDMDPQYAEGWYRVAESLSQQKQTSNAITQLKKALRIEPTHEMAQALLCTLENTSTYTNKSHPLKEDNVIISTPLKTEEKDDKDEDDERRRKKKKEDNERYETKRRSQSSPSPRRRRSRRRSISPAEHKSKRPRRLSPSHNSNKRRSHRRSSDDTASHTTKKHKDDRHRHRESSPTTSHHDKDRSKKRDNDDDKGSRHHSSRSKDKRRHYHRHHHQDRLSKRSSRHHDHDSSKRSSRHYLELK